MTPRELDAAGVTDPFLRAAYTRCRALNARHGRTYFLATRLLSVERRSAVHALYGFARYADDIVDDLDGRVSPAQRSAALGDLEAQWGRALRGEAVSEPAVAAAADTRARYGIPADRFSAFLASMRTDLSVCSYATYDELNTYMYGSAAVIGLQMVPVLGTVCPPEEAEPYAAALGIAFQLTNFLRDVGEDLDRGRVYLPADLLAAHGVDRDLLRWSRLTGCRDSRITSAMRAAADVTRRVYRQAEPGIALLDPTSSPCIRTAFVLYQDILDVIEAEGYAVVHRRAVVDGRRRARVALTGLAKALTARTLRRGVRGGPPPVTGARTEGGVAPALRSPGGRREARGEVGE
ncbi:phytoene/squalene synthase family protein [Streptomyces sp. NPDC048018]|uniref:phytoene/squalene synthase family protein n=1 Tax=Streptomyces sp. NPDC048018 TaxID=3365499 RepID=UPI0037183720